MPPRRKTAAPATTPGRTLLHSFSASKSTTSSAGTKRKLVETEVPTPATRAVIVQDGDEDVVRIVPIKSAPAATSPSPPKPSAGTKRLRLEDFVTRKTSATTSQRGEGHALSTSTSLSSPPDPEDTDASALLPEPLKFLVTIHASLMTTLLLHQAQSQTSGIYPSFSAVMPHIERLAHRKISLDDLRKIVWISHFDDDSSAISKMDTVSAKPEVPGLKLIDYGQGKVCVKFCEDGKSNLLNAERLRARFAKNALTFWKQKEAEGQRGERENGEEIARNESESEVGEERLEIPLAPLHQHAYTATIATVVHGKSQRIISEFKAKAAKASSSQSSLLKQKPGATSTVISRSSSLLGRIRAKAAATAPPPSPEELSRKAAEQRAPEVCEVLKGFRARAQSMGLKAVVEVVRESARNPIGAKEAELAVRFVAEKEDWCHVREWKGVEAVVFGGRDVREQFL